MTAHRAFEFCKQYKRTTEFCRLCEIIRNHLANLNKYRDQRDRPDLSAPESLQLYLDTRFEQLKIATELELWQEAFRSVEDIHGLMCMVKKTPKASLMVVYYAKLTEIFWVSGSHLYHAYAWFKLFSLQKSFNKNLSQKDLQLIASSVVLAALSVAPYDNTRGASHLELEHEKERNLRMANLIGFIIDPKLESREVLSRSSLLTELVAKGVMTCVTQEVKDLYHLLEHEFLPLDLASKVQPLLTKISKLGGKLASASSVPEVHLSQYIPTLEKLATLRLLQQVSQVYQSMKIENLSKMITFFEFSAVEKISIDAVKHNFLAMKVDHMKGVVAFGYSVTITPEVISKKLHREIINKLVELYRESHLGKRQLAYDGRKSVYTAGPLPFSSKDFVIKLVDQDRGARKDREFKVLIKFAAKPDIHHLQEFMRGRQLDTPQETIQVLDVVLRATLLMNDAVVGRSFFSPSFGVGDLGNGFQYWKGFYQSLRPIQMGLSLNIDMSARAFYEPILVTDFVAKYFNVKDLIRPLSDQECLKTCRPMKITSLMLRYDFWIYVSLWLMLKYDFWILYMLIL